MTVGMILGMAVCPIVMKAIKNCGSLFYLNLKIIVIAIFMITELAINARKILSFIYFRLLL
jgi:hypothetical protein